MTEKKQQKIARTAGVLTALVIVSCLAILLTDYLMTLYRTPKEKSLVESMEESVRTDAQVSLELTAERERLTEKSLARDSINQTVGLILMVGVAGFLICMNWLKSFEAESPLPFEKLASARLESGSATAVPEASLVALDTGVPEIDLSYVDQIVAEEGRTPDAAIPILRAIQNHYRYLPDEALKRVCEITDITPAQIAGTSSFYAQFRQTPVGKHLVRICHGTACHVSGVAQVTEELRRFLAIPDEADTDPSQLFTLDEVACLGCCSLAPVMMIDEQTVGKLSPASACQALHDAESERSS
jgi:NADH:ubiquinone oxidoreductase subunit E